MRLLHLTHPADGVLSDTRLRVGGGELIGLTPATAVAWDGRSSETRIRRSNGTAKTLS
jgi:hypothetical protein